MEIMSLKAKVFTTGRSQAVRLPAAFRFNTAEVYVRRDAATGDVVLSNRPPKKPWQEIFAALDAAVVPEGFLSDRDTTPPVEREWM
jgi:antitoxin VapB